MTTLDQMIEIIKAENPDGLRTGSEEEGYTDLTPIQYEEQILEWANNRLAKEAKAELIAETAIAKEALLTKLGITAEDAALLLS
jgi:hypothetical protein